VSETRSAILLEDPELEEHLSPERRLAARRDCIARVINVRPGEWQVEHERLRMRFGIGLLVLDGLLTRRVGVEGRFGAELLGAGDLLRPWQREDADTLLPRAGSWAVLRACRMAVLDGGFTLRLARYPEVTSALFARAVSRSRHLAVNMAIVHQPRIDVRLHMLFWQLADRWGTVHPEGVRVPLRLTHGVLSELVAARRPTVSKALGELAAREMVTWEGESWLLAAPPPAELGEVATIRLAQLQAAAAVAEG
jgi:CRP-like cAMP-binding protein